MLFLILLIEKLWSEERGNTLRTLKPNQFISVPIND